VEKQKQINVPRLTITGVRVVSTFAENAPATHAFFKSMRGANEGLFAAESSHEVAA
jgi:hypothetical protein